MCGPGWVRKRSKLIAKWLRDKNFSDVAYLISHPWDISGASRDHRIYQKRCRCGKKRAPIASPERDGIGIHVSTKRVSNKHVNHSRVVSAGIFRFRTRYFPSCILPTFPGRPVEKFGKGTVVGWCLYSVVVVCMFGNIHPYTSFLCLIIIPCKKRNFAG